MNRESVYELAHEHAVSERTIFRVVAAERQRMLEIGLDGLLDELAIKASDGSR